MEIQKVDSSFIDAIGFDSKKKRIAVYIGGSSLYAYKNCTKEQFEDFCNSDSKGKYFHKFQKENELIPFGSVTQNRKNGFYNYMQEFEAVL